MWLREAVTHSQCQVNCEAAVVVTYAVLIRSARLRVARRSTLGHNHLVCALRDVPSASKRFAFV